MDGRQLVVVEANEIPLRVVADLADSGRIPFLARLLDDGTLIETEIDEELPRELYPSQTWASMNTGVPWAEHGVFWYGDPKPPAYPMYWQVAARSGRSVGLVNTLHSSPLGTQCADGDYRFVIPDCFAIDDDTLPVTYRRFQHANTSLTGANSRQVALRPDPVDLVRLVLSLPRLGLRGRTMLEIAGLVGGVASGRVPRERLRVGQFLVERDLFQHLLHREAPDLAMIFTNHVAAAMHRYWYALYPQDFAEVHYDPAWVERHRDEVPKALELLDRFLSELDSWCRANDRTLLVVSSMGQGPSGRLDTSAGLEAVVVDAMAFLDGLDIETTGVQVTGSMAPQLTLVCTDADRASILARQLARVEAGEVFWDVDCNGEVVTLTYHLDVVDASTVRIGGIRHVADQVGVEVYTIEDHSSGRHIARGILGVSNSPTFKAPIDDVVDQLDVAPAVLAHLDIEPLAHHRVPEFLI